MVKKSIFLRRFLKSRRCSPYTDARDNVQLAIVYINDMDVFIHMNSARNYIASKIIRMGCMHVTLSPIQFSH